MKTSFITRKKRSLFFKLKLKYLFIFSKENVLFYNTFFKEIKDILIVGHES